jgi:hypothetical protein
VVRRIESLWGRQVEWCKLSELTERYLVSQTAQVSSEATRERVRIAIRSPFAADVLTFSIPMPWPLFQQPSVRLDGRALEEPVAADELRAGTWCRDGSVVTVSVKVERNVTREVVITPNGDPGLG